MANITLFGQIIQRLDRSVFNKLVKAYNSDKHNKGFDSWSHLVSMLFYLNNTKTQVGGLNYDKVEGEKLNTDGTTTVTCDKTGSTCAAATIGGTDYIFIKKAFGR